MVDGSGSKAETFLTLQVVDWGGPIVEIGFNRPIENDDDVRAVLVEAVSFMEGTVKPRADKAFFVTCYDGLRAGRSVLLDLQERFVRFNETYSLGDVRYGGDDFSKMFVITTSIRSQSRSHIFPTRGEALEALRERVAGS